jgi:lysophospholipase L1-like esterase
MKKLVGYGLIVLLVLGSIAAVEAGLRLLGLGEPLLYYENTSYRYAVRPNQRARRLHGAEVTIDSAGLRTTADWTQPADVKVLFIGDSVTWGGSNVDDRDLFSELVCVRLAERVAGRTFNCGNAGTNAYGVENMTARLTYDDAFGDEDVVVVTLVSGDAARGLQTLKALPFFAKPPPQPVPAIMELSAYAIDRLRHALRFEGAPPGPQPDHEAETTRIRLEALFDVLREKEAEGKRVLLVHSPDRTEVAEGYDPLQQAVVAAMRGSGFEFIEMRPSLQGRELEVLYYDVVHLGPEGHRLYADIIADRAAALLGRPAANLPVAH